MSTSFSSTPDREETRSETPKPRVGDGRRDVLGSEDESEDESEEGGSLVVL